MNRSHKNSCFESGSMARPAKQIAGHDNTQVAASDNLSVSLDCFTCSASSNLSILEPSSFSIIPYELTTPLYSIFSNKVPYNKAKDEESSEIITLRMFLASSWGPLDENEATTGAFVVLRVTVLYMVACGDLYSQSQFYLNHGKLKEKTKYV